MIILIVKSTFMGKGVGIPVVERVSVSYAFIMQNSKH